MNTFPLSNNRIDHYTIIVPNGKEVADFHEKVLGYKFLELKNINTGTAPEGSFDMANYIMEWPDESGRILVITEGLTEASIFHRFMLKYGQGIHHIALEIDDVDAAFNTLQEAGIRLTSPKVVTDMLSGLKQCFIDNTDTGVFIELIERKKSADAVLDATQKGFFTKDNMSGLAGTMKSYLDEENEPSTLLSSVPETGPAYEQRLTDLRLSTFIIEVEDVERAISFYVNILGFTKTLSDAGITELYLEQEPGIRFQIAQIDRPGFNCRLRCTTKSAGAAKEIMESYSLDVAHQDEILYLDKKKSGYDMQLSEAAAYQVA